MLKKFTILSIITSMVSTNFVNTDLSISNAITEKPSIQSESSDLYQKRFMELWNNINDPQNGYFSEKGVPYHSVETLMCEAPDYGHESTSEAFSYWIWLCAMYGRFTNDWTKVDNAWNATEKYIIPSLLDQPGMDKYPADKPASYAPEWEIPDKYPSELSDQVKSGSDPIHSELTSTYGTDIMYGMHWLLDVDNWYGYGRRGDGRTKPSLINTYQRGPQESVWETVPHPSWDSFKPGWGGKFGFVDLFVKDSAPAKQWRYSIATDADARAIQATYWANKWASEQGKGLPEITQKASKLGDYLRYGMFDKYFRKIGVSGKAGPGGTGNESCHYLLGWYYAWGGGLNGYWSWKIGSSHNHFGYQNPMAAWAMSTQDGFKPKSENGTADWSKSLDRQLDFYTWLQSDEGAIAGGCTNSYNGRYEEFPADTSKFYGMGYDANPVYLDPGSNTWFGFQAWSMQRIAELYYETGNDKAKTLMDKWTSWVKKVVKINEDGTFDIPSTISWEGQPYNWEGTRKENDNLHINIINYGKDLGITGALANTLLYYSAATKKWSTYDDESRALAKELLDRMWTLYKDDKGVAVEEARGDYKRFFDQEVYIPKGWTGTMPNGDEITSGVKFIDIRSKYKQDPDWKKVETAYKSGIAPVFKYHRFWAQCDIALALGTYSLLFGSPEVVKPSIGPSSTPTPTIAPVRGVINVKEYNANTTVKASSIRPRFLVTNVSSEPIKLEDFKLRYYYTNEGEEIAPEFTCDSASITNATGFHDNKKYAKYAFSYIEEPSEDADYYMEFWFNKGADSLLPGESIKIELRWNKPDWPIFYQDNDYSFNAKDEAPVDWDKTTAYIDGVLQWGKEPSCIKSVLPTPASTPNNTTPGENTLEGYIRPDFSFSQDISGIMLEDFNVELKAADIEAKTDSNGKFIFKNVPESSAGYSLRVSKSGYLTREIEVPTNVSTVSTLEKPILLWAGDLAGEGEQDGSINMKDIMVIAKSFNMIRSDNQFSEECDFNMDGSINMNDVIIMARNFNKVSEDYNK